MWERVIGRLPSGLTIFFAVVSIILPMGIYKLNQKLHNYGDPPWKRQEKNEDLPSQNSKTYTKKN